MKPKRRYYVVSPLAPLGGEYRSSRRVAAKEVSEHMRRYLTDRRGDIAFEAELPRWTEWACKLGAGLNAGAAPDGTHWTIESVTW
jgi:hypothetical protein